MLTLLISSLNFAYNRRQHEILQAARRIRHLYYKLFFVTHGMLNNLRVPMLVLL